MNEQQNLSDHAREFLTAVNGAIANWCNRPLLADDGRGATLARLKGVGGGRHPHLGIGRRPRLGDVRPDLRGLLRERHRRAAGGGAERKVGPWAGRSDVSSQRETRRSPVTSSTVGARVFDALQAAVWSALDHVTT